MKARYFCPSCGTYTNYIIWDVGKLPTEIDCEKCECIALFTEQEATHEIKGESVFLIPDEWQLLRYKKSEEEKYKRRGFSSVECEMLFSYELKKKEEGILILVKNCDL